ncbi:MAG: LPS-assembly protein LptD [Hyphomicrobiaceae bacterium]|nr:LPS-assembly protein LptD [Hyphomicrobiaceae bacterium]
MKYRFSNLTDFGHLAGGVLLRMRMVALLCLITCLTSILVLPVTSSIAQQNPILDPSLKSNPDAPMLLQADELIYDNKNNKVRAKGNVEVFYNKYTLLADEIIYDRNLNVLLAEGNVRIKEPDGAIVKAERIRLTDDFREGFIKSLKIQTSDDSTITADRATRVAGNTTIFENGSFTPCKTCREHPEKAPLWRIKAKKVIHNKEAQTISYEDARFEFMGVPLVYVPYFQHPDPSKKRQSGFLTPSITYSGDLGYISEIPYYIALAKNYDVTVTPVITTEAGQMLKSEWRHRLANGSYTIDMAGAYDSTPAIGTPDDRNFRGSVVTRGNFKLGSFWNFGWDATVETDDQFRRFYKLDNIYVTDRVSQVYLTGQSERNYMSVRTYRFGGLVQEDTADSNSWVLPIVDYNYILNSPVLGGEFSFNANAVALTRDSNPAINQGWTKVSENSSRLSADIGWRKELVDPIGQVITPFANARGDVYRFADPDDNNKIRTETRGTVLAGLEYRYPFIANLGNSSHIIEPIGQVIYRPDNKKLQNRLPNEDAQSLVFDDTLLFDSNKFSGYDRLETGARANVGVRYTINLPDGGNIRTVFGQSYQLQGVNPFKEANESGLETTRSDYVGGFYFEPSKHFGLIAQGRFDQQDFELRRTDIHSWMSYGPFTASANYVKQLPKLETSDLIGEEVTGSAGIKLTQYWSLTGNVRYDILDSKIDNHGGGITYADECFLFGVNYNRTTPVDLGLDGDTTISFRVEFKHLGGFQSSTSDLNGLVGDK